MAIEVFNRREIKYIINEDQYKLMIDLLDEYMQKDNNANDNEYYTVYNIYLDTINDDLISKSLLSPSYKEKVRLRSYYPFEDETSIFFEIKKKYNGIGNKRRSKMSYKDALNLINNKGLSENNNDYNKQVIKELEFICKTYDLKEKCEIFYDRSAYFGKDNDDLRITFDKNIVSIREGETFELLDSNKLILEIKTTLAMPLWLTSFLSKNNIQKTSFSKYGTEYTEYLKRKLKKEELHV